jgi:hypothetical protein
VSLTNASSLKPLNRKMTFQMMCRECPCRNERFSGTVATRQNMNVIYAYLLLAIELTQSKGEDMSKYSIVGDRVGKRLILELEILADGIQLAGQNTYVTGYIATDVPFL